MKRISIWVLAMAMTAGASSLLGLSDMRPQPRSTDTDLALNGAYRDGLYLGQQAARSRNVAHLAVGRWSTDEDRASFLAGYEAGYGRLLAPSLAETAGTN